MGIDVFNLCWDAQVSPVQKLVLLAIASHANSAGICWPSVLRLVAMTGLGERTVRRGIQDLIASGHLLADKKTGQASTYTIEAKRNHCHSGTPATSAPLPQRHHGGATAAPTPATAAPTPATAAPRSNKERIQELSRELPALPDWVSVEDWAAFVAMRQSIKAPMTDRAVSLIFSRLDQYRREGLDPNEALRNSVMNNWKGVFPPKESRQQKQAEGWAVL